MSNRSSPKRTGHRRLVNPWPMSLEQQREREAGRAAHVAKGREVRRERLVLQLQRQLQRLARNSVPKPLIGPDFGPGPRYRDPLPMLGVQSQAWHDAEVLIRSERLPEGNDDLHHVGHDSILIESTRDPLPMLGPMEADGSRVNYFAMGLCPDAEQAIEKHFHEVAHSEKLPWEEAWRDGVLRFEHSDPPHDFTPEQQMAIVQAAGAEIAYEMSPADTVFPRIQPPSRWLPAKAAREALKIGDTTLRRRAESGTVATRAATEDDVAAGIAATVGQMLFEVTL